MIPATIEQKRCPRCKQVLPRSAFHKNGAQRDGLASYCKPCKMDENAPRRAAESAEQHARWAPTTWTAKRPISEPERAYLAGIIDGEGSIFVSAKNASRGWTIIVTITNTDLRLIDWLEERWHANTTRARPGTGSQKPTYFWTATNRRVNPILEHALPYLVLKREQAEIALRWSAECRNHGRRGYPPEVRAEREAMLFRIQALNRKGPVLDGP